MTETIDPVELARALVACPSETPARGAVFDVLEEALRPLGFAVHRFIMGEAPDGPTENMVAIRKAGDGPHFGFAGHLDVVPAGGGWDVDPYEARIEDGVLIGRGACDMKSAIAAFVAALHGFDQPRGRSRSSSPATRKAMPPTARRGSSTGWKSATFGRT